MNDTDRCRPAVLRARLMLGVAGAIAATQTSALADQTAAPPAPDKWVPYTDIGGGYGSGMTAGKADAFVPIWQNMDSLLFADLGIGTETRTNQFENFGLGYRAKINPDWILGGYAGFDSTQLEDNNSFNQTALGAELMSAEWDMRLNGYIAGNEAKTHAGQQSLYINGTTIAVMDAQDAGYTGFDGEVGYRVFSTDNSDVRVFIGGFMFGHVDAKSTSLGESFDVPYRDIAGPKARAELTVYDLDILGPQSRLTLDGEVAHDDVRGTTGFIGATLRIPLGNFGGGAQALDELDRRMADPERRNDTVLTRIGFTKPEPVIIYGPHVTSQPTNTLLYVDNTQGVGTYVNPTTLSDAVGRNTTNAFIVITSKQGPVSTAGVTLQPGQTVVPGGQTFTVEGEYSHAKFTHDFDAATNVTLVSTNPNANVITLATNSTVYDVTIEGAFANAIYGKNVKNVDISHVTIDGAGVGTGIDIVNTSPGAQKISISNTTISDTDVGIRLDTAPSHGAIPATIKLSDVAISNTASDGIVIDTYAGSGTTVMSSVSLSNVTVTGAGGDGIDIYTHANGRGASISQTLTMSDVTVSGSGAKGIFFESYAQSAGAIASVAAMSGVNVTNSGSDGIEIERKAVGVQSSVAQVFAGSGITVSNSYGPGIALYATAKSGGTVQANDSFAGVTDTGAHGYYGVGISFDTAAYGAGSAVIQALSIAGANVSQSGVEGISLLDISENGGAVVSNETLANVSASGAGYGIYAIGLADGHGASITQNLTITGATVADTAAGGISVRDVGYSGGRVTSSVNLSNETVAGAGNGVNVFAGANGTGTTVRQTVSAANITISNTEFNGLGVSVDSYGGGQASGTVTLSGVKVSNAGGNGVYVSNSAGEYGTASLTATIAGVSVTNAGIAGVDVSTSGRYGDASSTLTLANIAVSGARSAGIGVYANSSGSGASVYQTLAISQATSSGAGFNGVSIADFASQGSHTTVNAQLSGLTVENASHDGIAIYARALGAGATLSRSVTLSNASVTNGGEKGVVVGDYAYGGGQITDKAVLSGIDVSGARLDGFYGAAIANGAGSSINQTIEVSNATFADVYKDGIELLSRAELGATVASSASLSGITVTAPSRDGLYFYAGSFGTGASVDQTVSVSHVTITHAGSYGVYVSDDAFGGGDTSDNIKLSYVGIAYSQNGGARVHTDAYGSTADSTFSLSNASLENPGRYGIYLSTYAGGGATVVANATLSGVTVNNASVDGLSVYTRGFRSNETTSLTLANVAIATSGRDGIQIQDHIGYDAQLTTNTSMSGLTVSGSGQYGVTYRLNANSGSLASGSFTIAGANVSGSGIGGLELFDQAYGSGSAVTSHISLSDITVDGAGFTGVNVGVEGSLGGAARQYVTVTGATISHTGTAGIGAMSGISLNARSFESGSYAYQSASLSNVVVSYDGGGIGSAGIGVNAITFFGGGVVQNVSIQDSSVTHSDVGLGITADSFYNGAGPATVQQTVAVAGSTFSNNTYRGISIEGLAQGTGGYHSQAATSQTVSISNSTINGNGVGVYVYEQARNGASASQTVSFYNVAIEHNAGNGVYVKSFADSAGFAGQNIAFNNQPGSYNEVAYNGGNGITLSPTAVFGGEADQRVYIYQTHVDGNSGNGILALNTVSGYGVSGSLVYYSHLQQNIIAAYGSASGNGLSGIVIDNVVKYGAQADEIVELYKESVNHNAFYGFVEYSTVSALPGRYTGGHATAPRLTSNVYIQNSDVSYNGTTGILVKATLYSPMYRPPTTAYSYLEQHVTLGGDSVEHNGFSGVAVTAYDHGVFGIIAQYVTLQASQFSYNGHKGAVFGAFQYYGPGAFGAAVQDITIEGSGFNHNGRDGLYAYAYATGVQGRAEQHFVIEPYATSAGTLYSHFDYNGQSGIYLRRIAQNGVSVPGYACSAVQGLTGGCAFVRQTFEMLGGSANGNGENGLSIVSYASNYGAIYAESGRPPATPTVLLENAHFDNNGFNGFTSYSTAKNHSYAYHYIVAVNSTFNNNGNGGFGASVYASGNSSIVARNILYGYATSASGNHFDGVVMLGRATSGSTIASENRLYSVATAGITVAHNGYDGVFIEAGYNDETSHFRQVNYFGGDVIAYNARDGIALLAFGNGTGHFGGGYQRSALVANTVVENGRYGLYGFSATGAAQYINVYTGGNTIAGNTAGNQSFRNLFGQQYVY